MADGEKFHLTKEGLKKIKKEYEILKKLKMAKAKEEVPRILHSEDVNPEYLSFIEDFSALETKIAELEHILKNFKLIKSPPKKQKHLVNLGATVLVEIDGKEEELTIVGRLEANPAVGKISNESPVGRALLGKKVGDEVKIPNLSKPIYKIKKIKYQLS